MSESHRQVAVHAPVPDYCGVPPSPDFRGIHQAYSHVQEIPSSDVDYLLRHPPAPANQNICTPHMSILPAPPHGGFIQGSLQQRITRGLSLSGFQPTLGDTQPVHHGKAKIRFPIIRQFDAKE